MRKALATLSIREEFTYNLIYFELGSLAELYNIDIENIDKHSKKIILRGDIGQIFNMTCRSIFIKSVTMGKLEIRYPRGFLLRQRPLEKVDTASAPLEITLSRLLLNISKVDTGSRVLDPFSGVGGILFEARMLGAYTIGVDLVERYLKVQKKNINDIDQILSDSSYIVPFRENSIDAIVTDPPYSKLSIIDIDIDMLYRNLSKICSRVLKKGSRVAISCICSIPVEEYLEENGLEVLCVGFQYVHKTMVRKIVCAEK